jgi:hypothetical protein
LEVVSQRKKREPPKHLSPPFKEKEKEGEGRSKAQWPMEGGGEGSWLGGQWKEEEKVLGLVANGRRRRRFLAWWPMEGGRRRFLAWWPMEGGRRRFLAWWPMEVGREGSFLPLPLFPQTTLLKPSFFILHIKVLLCPGPRPLFTPSLRFP